jgi:hypothetical protein
MHAVVIERADHLPEVVGPFRTVHRAVAVADLLQRYLTEPTTLHVVRMVHGEHWRTVIEDVDE